MCCRATSRGGYRACNIQTIPVNETRAEVAALLFSDMGNCCPVSPLCVCIPLRLREIIVHGQDWFLEKDKTLQLKRTEEKKHTSWHTIKCILSSCSEGGGSGWVLIIQTMKTIKSRRNTGEISFRQARISTHACTSMNTESPAPAHVSAMIVKITIISGAGFHPHLHL